MYCVVFAYALSVASVILSFHPVEAYFNAYNRIFSRSHSKILSESINSAHFPRVVLHCSYLWADSYSTSTSDPIGSNNHTFKLISYNILAPINGEGEKHSYAAVSITKWTRRRDKIVADLKRLKADIYCLQEVSAKSLKDTLIPQLTTLGLECCAYAPGKIADKASGKYAHRQIGNAIFIRTSKFQVLDSQRLHLRDYCSSILSTCSSNNFVVDVQSRFDSMALVHLKLKATNQTYIIGNTHLYWNPLRPDIKAIQTFAAITALHKFTLYLNYNSTQDIPIILAGDLNSMPTNQLYDMNNYYSVLPSAPFVLLSTGQLQSNHTEHPDAYFNNVRNSENPKLGSFKFPFNFSNIYCLPEFENQKPLFTTKTDDFQGWIDHIWVNSKVEVSYVLVPPVRVGDLEANFKARKFIPIPSIQYPSDHLPIGLTASVKM